MNIFNFTYLGVMKDLFLAMAWGLFFGFFIGFFRYMLFSWVERKTT